ncbi:DDE-type integrase/transposase/recombinase, partial [Aduncisulcus paluster]
FTLKTDHRNLVYIQKAPNAKLTRWRLRLEEFEFVIEHVPGRDNIIADVLSSAHKKEEIFHLNPCSMELSESLKKRIKDSQRTLEIKDGDLHIREDGLKTNLKGEVVIPPTAECLKKDILQWCHGTPMIAHGGVTATINVIKTLGITWINLKKDVE